METRRIPTGASSLDKLLRGGVQTSALTLIYGEPSVGKTVLALSVSSKLLKMDPGAGVMWIDSDGKFSTDRFKQVAGENVFRRFWYSRPTSLDQQAFTIDSLPNKVGAGDLVVVDSVTSLYRFEASSLEKTFSQNKELNRQLGQMRDISLSVGVAVVITGQVRGVPDQVVQTIEPVAQRLLRFWADIVIRLDHTPLRGVKQATVEKPMSLRGACRFSITADGVGE